LLRQAMMMDPLTGAVCNPPEIWQLADEMLVAGEQWLPQYQNAIAAAKITLAGDNLISTRDYQGAARLKTATIEELEAKRGEVNKRTSASEKAGK
ncbi:MAG: alpha-glucosidase/alpha-galactosidase, partial [bacterium]